MFTAALFIIVQILNHPSCREVVKGWNWFSHVMESYWVITKEQNSHARHGTEEPQGHCAGWRESDAEAYTLRDLIYIEFQDNQTVQRERQGWPGARGQTGISGQEPPEIFWGWWKYYKTGLWWPHSIKSLNVKKVYTQKVGDVYPMCINFVISGFK